MGCVDQHSIRCLPQRCNRTIHIIFVPEFYLGKCDEAAATREIQQTMRRYLDDGVFRTVPHGLVLVQRTLPGGAVRCGIAALEGWEVRL